MTPALNKTFINKQVLLAIMLILVLSACSLKASEPIPAPIPAILPTSSASVSESDLLEFRRQINAIVTKSLGGQKVPIAKEIFSESSRLLIGAKPVIAPNGVTVYEESHNATLVFELLKQDNNCLLRRLDTMQSWRLKANLCIAR